LAAFRDFVLDEACGCELAAGPACRHHSETPLDLAGPRHAPCGAQQRLPRSDRIVEFRTCCLGHQELEAWDRCNLVLCRLGEGVTDSGSCLNATAPRGDLETGTT
jgi:hypothetical protein